MDSTAHLGHLLGLADALAGVGDPIGVVDAALPAVLAIAGAEAAMVVSAAAPSEEAGPRRATAQAGVTLTVEDLVEVPAESEQLVSIEVPATWRDQGISQVAGLKLPGHVGVLLLAWTQADVNTSPALELALKNVEAALVRALSQESLADLSARVDNAQHLANMGDYDWHIPTDTNRWSDQLFRIYGHEPQSFNASYERFLSLVHPDDRERITALHQQAYGSGEPWQVIERIVRPRWRGAPPADQR